MNLHTVTRNLIFVVSLTAELLLEGRRYSWSQTHHHLCAATHSTG